MARGIEDHLEEEEAPIPVLSPLEVASAPLEKLIEDAKTKVNTLWFLKYVCIMKYNLFSIDNWAYFISG